MNERTNKQTNGQKTVKEETGFVKKKRTRKE